MNVLHTDRSSNADFFQLDEGEPLNDSDQLQAGLRAALNAAKEH